MSIISTSLKTARTFLEDYNITNAIVWAVFWLPMDVETAKIGVYICKPIFTLTLTSLYTSETIVRSFVSTFYSS